MPRPVPGPRITCGPRAPKPTGPIGRAQPCGIAGSDKRLRLEIVEQQPLSEAEPPRRLGAVHHPGRVGELELAPVDRPGAADEQRARPRAERGDRRLGRFDEAGIIVGLEMNRRAERRVGRRLQGEARVGAADIDDDDRERYDEIAHGGP